MINEIKTILVKSIEVVKIIFLVIFFYQKTLGIKHGKVFR